MQNYFPKWLTTFSILLTLMLLGGLLHEVYQYRKSLVDLQERHIPTLELSGIVIRMNEVLNSSIQMWMASGDERWKESYQNYRFAMDDTLEQFSKLLQNNMQSDSENFIDHSTEAKLLSRESLNQVEHRILSLPRGDHSIIKLSAIYKVESTDFRDLITNRIEILNQNLSDDLDLKKKRSKYMMYIFLGIFSVLLILWFFLGRSFRHNILHRQAAEDDLIVSKARFKDVALLSGDWIWELDSDWRYTHVYGDYKELLGYEADEIIGKTPYDFMAEDDIGQVKAEIEAIAGHYRMMVDIENWNTAKDGRRILLLANGTPIFDKDGKYLGYRGVDKDITAQREAEEDKNDMKNQIFQSSKLASIGVLSSGIAHELNNPLTGILGFSEIIQKVTKSDKVAEYSSKIIKACKRMQKIINHLRQFSRKSDTTDWKPICINEVVNDSLIFLERQLVQRDIEIKLCLNKDACTIMGDANQLESIFQNLLTNSRDAFDNIDSKGEKWVRLATQIKDGNIIFHYEDNAGGIPLKIQEKVFDPFFTTKEVGKGTGLGLSILHRIVKEHDAALRFKSVPGTGTEFSIEFPMIDEELQIREGALLQEQEDQEPHREATIEDDNKAKILIIDDEVMIGELLVDAFSEYFHVEFFADSELGMKRIEEQSFDLILSDLKMPKHSGMELFACASKNQPETPFFIMSGHAQEDDEIRTAMAQGVTGAIAKPFGSLDEIVDSLRKYIV